MRKIRKACLNCKIAENDPEMGYTCSGEHWLYFGKAKLCPYYEIDEEYLLDHAQSFIEKMSVRRFIRQIHKENRKLNHGKKNKRICSQCGCSESLEPLYMVDGKILCLTCTQNKMLKRAGVDMSDVDNVKECCNETIN